MTHKNLADYFNSDSQEDLEFLKLELKIGKHIDDVDKVKSYGTKYRLPFKIDDAEYIAVGDLIEQDGQTVLEFKFSQKTKPKFGEFETSMANPYTTEITGTGNPFKVFMRAIGIMHAMVEKTKPDNIQFSAMEENRRSLYDKMCRYFAGEFPNYERAEINPLTNKKLNDGEFWFKRKTKS